MLPNGEEDISPYATFHLLGMREENKNGINPANFQTMPNQGGPMMPPGAGAQTGPNTPAHQRNHVSQTMNPRRSLANPGPPVPMPQQQQQQAVYDAPNCDYDPPSYMEQNFGNPYDCPEGMYNGSMMSSVGYSQVSDHAQNLPPQGVFPPRGGQPLPGMTALPPPPSQQFVNNTPGNTDTVIYKPDGRGPSYMMGPPQQQARNPPPQPCEEDYLPPPPPVRPTPSADVSLNDSASTTQSNVTSECSEAECDREPLVKPGNNANGGNRGKNQ